MNRLGVRLMLSHLLVAVVGSVVTFLLVRLLAPPLFDESLRRAGRAGYVRGYGQVLRQEFASAVDTALAIGVLAGLVVAIVRLAIDQGRPVPLRADPDRIAQVVTNLVGNALRATPRGGTVRVGVRGEERSGSVVVADTRGRAGRRGPGTRLRALLPRRRTTGRRKRHRHRADDLARYRPRPRRDADRILRWPWSRRDLHADAAALTRPGTPARERAATTFSTACPNCETKCPYSTNWV